MRMTRRPLRRSLRCAVSSVAGLAAAAASEESVRGRRHIVTLYKVNGPLVRSVTPKSPPLLIIVGVSGYFVARDFDTYARHATATVIESRDNRDFASRPIGSK